DVAGAGSMTLIRGGTGLRRTSNAAAALTSVADRAGVVIAATCTVGCRQIGTSAAPGITCASNVTLVRGGTGLLRTSNAAAVLTSVADRAGVVIAATCTVGCRPIGTSAAPGITCASNMTLVRGGTGLRRTSNAAAALTSV